MHCDIIDENGNVIGSADSGWTSAEQVKMMEEYMRFQKKQKMKVQETTRYPYKYKLCDKCKNEQISPWLAEELDQFPYLNCRNDLIMVAKRDLCNKCADTIIKAFDEANEYNGG